jgi:hypothetical protein
MEKIRVGLEMDKELHRQLKVKTAQEGTTMSAILIECAQQYVNAPPDRTTETREDYKPGK